MADETETTLRELLKSVAEDLNYSNPDIEVKAVTSGGANYTSALYQASIKNGLKEVKLFAKVAIVGDKMRQIMNADQLFVTERFVYNKLAKIYESLQDKHNVPEEERFVFPKFYACNPDAYKETVVLEDLIARDFRSFNRFKSLDWEHASAAVEVLAKFHALSFAYLKENPEEFQEVAKEYSYVRLERGEDFKEMWLKLVQKRLTVLKEEHARKVMKFLEKGGDTMFEYFNTPKGSPVLIHGDYRLSNLLFKSEGDKIRVIPVDFQTLRSGCPATDLVYLVFMGSDQAFRARHYEGLVDHYYRQLELGLGRLGMDAAEVYSRERFDGDMKVVLPYAVLLGITILPLVTVEAENAPRVDGDADVSGFFMNCNDLYAERFSGVIEDMVRWGII